MDQSIKRAAYEIGLIFPLNRHRHGRGYRYRRRPCHLAGNGTTHWRIGFISSSDGWKMHRLLAVRIKRVEMSCRGFLPPSLLSDPPPHPPYSTISRIVSRIMYNDPGFRQDSGSGSSQRLNPGSSLGLFQRFVPGFCPGSRPGSSQRCLEGSSPGLSQRFDPGSDPGLYSGSFLGSPGRFVPGLCPGFFEGFSERRLIFGPRIFGRWREGLID